MAERKCFCYLIPEIQSRLTLLEDPEQYNRAKVAEIEARDREIAQKAAELLDKTRQIKAEYERAQQYELSYAYKERIDVLKGEKQRFNKGFLHLYTQARELFVDLPYLSATEDEMVMQGMELLSAAFMATQ